MSNTKNTSDSQTRQESSHNTQDSREATEDNTGTTTHSTADRRLSPMEVLRQAREQLAELTGMAAESVSSFERTEEGWALEVEVLELERVPDTMSLMATYQVELDHDGLLTGYRRAGRYERGRADARGRGGR
ncbi:hypothetical protein SUDANB58_04950 [Streptomyces sp. enrichment culture]|uniref:gas vesicle protein GvpO n=1 Tax=Streptomyces sp. enrichment culture TaxID=1795815 RepID=UPI003F57C349